MEDETVNTAYKILAGLRDKPEGLSRTQISAAFCGVIGPPRRLTWRYLDFRDTERHVVE